MGGDWGNATKGKCAGVEGGSNYNPFPKTLQLCHEFSQTRLTAEGACFMPVTDVALNESLTGGAVKVGEDDKLSEDHSM